MVKKLKYKFRLNGGLHAQYEGAGKNRKVITYKKGDIVISEVDLAKVFGKKFQSPDTEVSSHVMVDSEGEEIANTSDEVVAKAFEAGRQAVLSDLAKTEANNEELRKKEKKGSSPEPEFPFGVDETDLFPAADEEDLLVFQKDGFYTVVEKDSPNESANPGPLESLESVQEFIAEYAGAED